MAQVGSACACIYHMKQMTSIDGLFIFIVATPILYLLVRPPCSFIISDTSAPPFHSLFVTFVSYGWYRYLYIKQLLISRWIKQPISVHQSINKVMAISNVDPSIAANGQAVATTSPTAAEQFTVYPRRFWVLFVLSLAALQQGNIWLTYRYFFAALLVFFVSIAVNDNSPIAGPVQDLYGWDDFTITLLVSWGPLAYIPSIFVAPKILDKIGLRASVSFIHSIHYCGTLHCADVSTSL
jgi:hypothetical protein